MSRAADVLHGCASHADTCIREVPSLLASLIALADESKKDAPDWSAIVDHLADIDVFCHTVKHGLPCLFDWAADQVSASANMARRPYSETPGETTRRVSG